MPRQPTKNRIAMHDIIGQPLSALPDAVNAIIRRPEPLDDVEVQDIFQESSYILLRAEEALSVEDGESFCALFKLFSEGFAHSDGLFEEGIKTFVLHGSLLEAIFSIFRVVVGQRRLPYHSPGTVELVQVIGNLCDGEALKDNCGALFMSELAQLLVRIYEDNGDAARYFHIQRGVATALINLVKGSKQNKLRLSSWKFVADCCVASVDVFFQLQCIELLFRVSRQKKSVLTEIQGLFHPDIFDKLCALPNDSTLLRRMTSLIQDLNAETPKVLRFPLKRVDAADTMLTEGTEAYFTPHYFIVMVTLSNADNITVPYKFIRSVTLGKDGRVIIKLEEFPVKLEVLLSRMPGMDTVTLYLTVERLRAFKQAAIRGWIVSELTAKKATVSLQSEKVPTHPIFLPPSNHDHCSISGLKRQSSDYSHEEPIDRPLELPTDATAPAQSLKLYNDAPHKKAKFELSTPLTVLCPSDLREPILGLINSVVENASSEEAYAIVAQLNHLIDAKLELHHEEAVTSLNNLLTVIQMKVDSARSEAAKARSTCQQSMMAKVEQLEQHITVTQDAVVAGVLKLNDELRQVKQGNQALHERIALIEFELQRTLEESRDLESRELRELQDACQKEIERQEFELDKRLINRSNSTASLFAYLHKTPACSDP